MPKVVSAGEASSEHGPMAQKPPELVAGPLVGWFVVAEAAGPAGPAGSEFDGAELAGVAPLEWAGLH